MSSTDISYVQSQADKVPPVVFENPSQSPEYGLKLSRGAEAPWFFVKLRDDSQAPAGRDASVTFDHSDIRGSVTA